jgi:hypothetical protein
VFTSWVSVLIARPLDEVFAFVGDVRNRPSWDDSVDSEELTSPEPIGVGSTVRTRLRSMGKEYVYTWEIGEHEPPHRMRVASTSGPFRRRSNSRLQRGGRRRISTGATRV